MEVIKNAGVAPRLAAGFPGPLPGLEAAGGRAARLAAGFPGLLSGGWGLPEGRAAGGAGERSGDGAAPAAGLGTGNQGGAAGGI